MSEPTRESEPAHDSLSGLEAALGHRFAAPDLLLTALTHRSYINETDGTRSRHNESLEFLGDSVLGFLVSSRVFRRFPDLAEGDLSKMKAYLVSAANLVRVAERIQIGGYLRLGRGEDKTGGRNKRAILVDALEAVIGALYLDGGIEAASAFLERHLLEALDRTDFSEAWFGDFKSALQEKIHILNLPDPVYRVVDEIGPDHRKTFVVQVIVKERVLAEASGPTKKEAQQEAAQRAIERLEIAGREAPPE